MIAIPVSSLSETPAGGIAGALSGTDGISINAKVDFFTGSRPRKRSLPLIFCPLISPSDHSIAKGMQSVISIYL